MISDRSKVEAEGPMYICMSILKRLRKRTGIQIQPINQVH